MAYDQSLASRVTRSLAGRPDVNEKPMYGGLTYMVAGNMCCGVNRNDLILRLDPTTSLEDLRSPYIRPWDFMKRPMRGIFAVSAQGCATQSAVDHWVKLALGHVLSLPPKNTRPAKMRQRAR